MNIFTAVKYCCILHGRVCVKKLPVGSMEGQSALLSSTEVINPQKI